MPKLRRTCALCGRCRVSAGLDLAGRQGRHCGRSCGFFRGEIQAVAMSFPTSSSRKPLGRRQEGGGAASHKTFLGEGWPSIPTGADSPDAGLAPLPRTLMRWPAPAVSESNLCQSMRAGSPTEERPIEPSGLRRGQAWLREHVDHFIGQVPLPKGKRRRVALVPAQSRTDVRIEPDLLARDLVGSPVKLADLVQQRLELPLVDRHNGLEVSFLHEPLAHSPLRLSTGASPPDERRSEYDQRGLRGRR